MNIDYYEIGKRVRAARKARSMSQEQLAEMVDVGTSHISHIENGHTKMSIQVLVMLSNALHISADELLCDHIYAAKQVLHDEIAVLLNDCNSEETRIITDIAKTTKTALRRRSKE